MMEQDALLLEHGLVCFELNHFKRNSALDPTLTTFTMSKRKETGKIYSNWASAIRLTGLTLRLQVNTTKTRAYLV